MASLYTYSPDEISFNLGGVSVGGFEEGTFITIEKAEDDWSTKSGISGDCIRILKKNLVYTVTATLMYSSESNDYLSGLSTADFNLPGAGLVSIKIKDSLGRGDFVADSAWVIKPATVTYSDAADPKEWTIQVWNAKNVVAGM